MDIRMADQYLILGVIVACCCIGYVIKTSLDFIPNKYIPLIMLIVGILCNIFINNGALNFDVLIGGAVSGVSSTGFYETYKNLIINRNSNN